MAAESGVGDAGECAWRVSSRCGWRWARQPCPTVADAAGGRPPPAGLALPSAVTSPPSPQHAPPPAGLPPASSLPAAPSISPTPPDDAASHPSIPSPQNYSQQQTLVVLVKNLELQLFPQLPLSPLLVWQQQSLFWDLFGIASAIPFLSLLHLLSFEPQQHVFLPVAYGPHIESSTQLYWSLSYVPTFSLSPISQIWFCLTLHEQFSELLWLPTV
mmetsp:Transcript_14768/g.20240  ORF Transcript_14768/g.20240 Transcript_14768/m.20240 type:complete len:215 (-) Transcript_14768:2070-2714(-)